MGKYIVSGYLTISVSKEIEAKSAKDAKRKAEELACPSLCHQCCQAGDDDHDAWPLNGFDDPPLDCVRNVERLKAGE